VTSAAFSIPLWGDLVAVGVGSLQGAMFASGFRGQRRLDLLGGVADYSGALVLETPTQLATTVTAEPADALVVGPVTITVDEIAALARRPYAEIRGYAATSDAHHMVQPLPDGRLLLNELAPRPHNSGHLTIDAHVTCQFEQQLRAVCGLPLGTTAAHAPAAAMANLLGDEWSGGEPDWAMPMMGLPERSSSRVSP